MKLGYFTERPVRWVPEEVILKNGAHFAVSNSYFDRERASADYNYFIDENLYAEELGFDIVALNEHHGNPFCMGSVMNVEAGILARLTKKAHILLIGNPLPVLKHPLRMAEELAEIDLISKGRLITGWVRGAGSEQFFNNANPAYNREYFEEAHDFIVQAWTRPGPWRYEGKHFHYRHVNPWALPYQKPHPQMWIPGTLSPETIRWCAEHNYPYFGLGTALPATCDMWDLYADEALKHGFEAGPENFGYLLPTFVAETDEKAQELGQGFLFGGGQNTFARVEHTLPPGYNSKEAIQRLAKQPQGSWLGISGDKMKGQTKDEVFEVDAAKVRQKLLPGYQRAQKNLQFMIGSPKTVIPKIKALLTTLRPGSLIVFNVQGPVSNKDRQTSMRLIAQEVMPAIKEHADSIGLVDAITKVPGTTKARAGVKRNPVADRGLLKELGLHSPRIMRLKDKVALITGAGSGMGRATATLFAKEGAKVAVVDINAAGAEDTVRRITSAGGEAVAIRADVSNSEDASSMVSSAVKKFGGLDIIYNNAGIEGEGRFTAEVTEEQFDRVIAINLRGVWLGMKYALPELVKRGGGVVISTASIAGLIGLRGSVAYSAAKAGVIGMTRVVAVEYGRYNIRANCICPGFIHTEMADRASGGRGLSEKFVKRASVFSRMGEPEEIAQTALFLASDDCKFATGQPFVIDGGWISK